MEIQHVSHKHPLILTSEEKDDDGVEIICNLCAQKITTGSSSSTSSYYRCSKCSFNLHKLCAKLPTEIKHPVHPEKTLTLFDSCKSFQGFNCESCDKSVSGFAYYQGPMLYRFTSKDAIDIKCAAKTVSVKHEFHKHPLTPMLSSALFECHACGTQHQKGMSYMCNTCIFWIHEDCASLPTPFKHRGHVHLLILRYSSPSYNSCRVCEEGLVQDFWVYQCETCQYYVHVNCSTKTRNSKTVIEAEDLDDVTNLIHLPHDNGSIYLIDQFIKQISLGHAEEDIINKGEAGEEEELNHFSHNHPLILFFDDAYQLCSSKSELSIPNEKKNEKICDACVRPILGGSFYSCGRHNNLCNFFLHKWCAKLPKEIQHPFHPYPLSLMRMSDPRRIGDYTELYYCKCCGKISNGLGFNCTHNECKESNWEFYCLDVKCTSLPGSIVHELHEHPLHLRPNCVNEGCGACDECRWEFAYVCDHCSFSLHYDCALLPRTIKHRYDKHPFTLTYRPIQDGPKEYICEFCENDMDPNKWWFYHCIDCDQSACARCIYYKEENRHSNIKFRNNKNCNCHTLTSVYLENRHTLCDYCHKSFESSHSEAYACAKCKTVLHKHCMLL